MANTEKQFKEYLDNIRLTDAALAPLRTSRNANRERIKDYWKDVLKRPVPSFDEQGSYEMGTGVEPLNGDHDLDDGVYLNCIGDDPAKWPATSTVQDWIAAAVSGYTKSDPQKRKRCVRVPYAADYHIDLPVYGTDAAGKYRLYEKGKQPAEFVESNAAEFAKWFKEKKDATPKIRDVVRFLKAWRDYQGGGLRRLKGVGITILVANNIQSFERFDETVAKTARACANHLMLYRSIVDPVAPWENITASWSSDDMDAVIADLNALADRGDAAIKEEKVRDAALIWNKEFGDRYPVPDEEVDAENRAFTERIPPVIGSGTYA